MKSENQIYRDEHYCCLDCGFEKFEVRRGTRDACVNCGSLRDTKRGPKDAR